MSDLTPRQRAVLEFIADSMESHGYPPSVREIGEAVGLSSSSSVHAQLASLQKKGFIRRDPTKPRAIEIRFDRGSGSATERRPARFVPLVGEIAAGQPVLASEAIDEALPLPADWLGNEDDTLFMLSVKGDSMIDAGIHDGDFVIVRQQPSASKGDIVAALIDDEATVKRFERRRDRIVLIPENATMSEMVFDDVDILGKVIAVIRRI